MPEDKTQDPEFQGPPENANAIQLDCWRRQELFLAAFQQHGIAAVAAEETGIPIGTVDYWRTQDTQGFKRRKALADRSALGVVEKEIHRRAIEGIEKPIYYKGERVDTIMEYSDNLLMFRAKRLDPEYRDNLKQQQVNSGPAHTVINIIVPPGGDPRGLEKLKAEPRGQVVEGKSREVEDDEKEAPSD